MSQRDKCHSDFLVFKTRNKMGCRQQLLMPEWSSKSVQAVTQILSDIHVFLTNGTILIQESSRHGHQSVPHTSKHTQPSVSRAWLMLLVQISYKLYFTVLLTTMKRNYYIQWCARFTAAVTGFNPVFFWCSCSHL